MTPEQATTLYEATARAALADLEATTPAAVAAMHRALTQRLDDAEAGRVVLDDETFVMTLARHAAYTALLALTLAASRQSTSQVTTDD